MHVTECALRDEDVTVGEVAARFGYRSEAAFARAFKRVTRMPPGAARRATHAPAAGSAALSAGARPGG
jgi:AraC-like DNA-binding protein